MDNESRLPKPLYHLFEVTAFGLLVAGSITDSWATLNLVDIGTNTHLEGQMGLWQVCTETCYATVYEGGLLTVVLLFCIGGAMCIIPGILMYCYKGKIFYIYGLSQILGGILLAVAVIIYSSKNEEIAKSNILQYITKSVTLNYSFYLVSAGSGVSAVTGLMSFYIAYSSVPPNNLAPSG